MMKKLGLSIAGISLLAMGCGVENEDYSTDRFSDRSSAGAENPEFNFDRGEPVSADVSDAPAPQDRDNGATSVVVRDGSIFTSAGGFEVNGQADDISSYGNTQHLNTYLTRTDDASAMLIIDIENLIDPAFIEVGRTTLFRNGQRVSDEASAGDPSLVMVVCAGPEEGNWEVDQMVPEVEITVDETDEGERVLIIDSEMMNAELVLDIRS